MTGKQFKRIEEPGEMIAPGSFFKRRVLGGAYNAMMIGVRQQLEMGAYDLNPPYQRGLVWTLDQKVALIDTLCMGMNIPTIYLREKDETGGSLPWLEVVDGKQRLTTLWEFMNDGFPYRGKVLSEWSEQDQRIWESLFIQLQHLIRVSDEEVRVIYDRINFCGTPHAPEDRKPLP